MGLAESAGSTAKAGSRGNAPPAGRLLGAYEGLQRCPSLSRLDLEPTSTTEVQEAPVPSEVHSKEVTAGPVEAKEGRHRARKQPERIQTEANLTWPPTKEDLERLYLRNRLSAAKTRSRGRGVGHSEFQREPAALSCGGVGRVHDRVNEPPVLEVLRRLLARSDRADEVPEL
jgi:hypothetical protein